MNSNHQENKHFKFFFHKENIIWMLIGLLVIAMGLILMSGGRNTNPNVWDVNLVYSSMRITVAPILIILGFLIEIFAILKKSKAE
ncbi:MAG: DUF3098 domain-containing protein [Phycisphaerales bacterium]|nr:DUF3098 domain-containing protein [Phycisphaerales bacterium]